MKKKTIALALSALMITGLVGCRASSDNKEATLKVGMVTDSGSIDDKSFNQGTWEGIERAEKELSIDKNYIKPAGEIEAEYLKEIGNLYDNGYKFIITPGFKFESAIYKAQETYKDANFVLIDGSPKDENGNSVVADNTVSIFFAEEQAGFSVGVATAVQLKDGKLGFVGGMEIPSVQKFNWGFQQGIKYANENLGTKVTIDAENVVYEGTFNNVAGGQQIAATMYDRGVKAIFAAAGGVGVGVINEAKARAVNGKEVWVVGVDTDQYKDGVYEDGKSVVLTSAIKKIDEASFQMIKDKLNDQFKGGETLVFDAKNDGIGIPEENQNLSEEAKKATMDAIAKMKSGEVVVSNEKGDLIK